MHFVHGTREFTSLNGMHLDDFIFCGNYTFQRNEISELKIIFKVGTHDNRTFKFWGLGIKQTKDGPKCIGFISIFHRLKEGRH